MRPRTREATLDLSIRQLGDAAHVALGLNRSPAAFRAGYKPWEFVHLIVGIFGDTVHDARKISHDLYRHGLLGAWPKRIGKKLHLLRNSGLGWPI